MQQSSARSSHTTHRRRPRLVRAARWLHLAGAIALIVGLFLPMAGLSSAALASPLNSQPSMALSQSADDTVPPAPSQVAAVGDFQAAVGCDAFDPYCGATQLSNTNGIWTGVFAVPPGSYQWQIQAVSPDGNVYSYGQGGLGGGAGSVTVGDGEIGLYFELNTHSNEAATAAVSELYTASVDGTQLALQPSGGQLTALMTSPGGTASVQMLAGGEPVGEPQSADLAPGPNRITFTTDGQLVNVESLQGGSVTVERLDADGTPVPGGCYQLRSGSVVNQGCDADDGADGYTTMTFPAGMPGGTVDVVEVTAPDGAEPVDSAQLDLQPGNDLLVTLQAAGGEVPQETEVTEATQEAEETETTVPGGQTGDLFVALQDQGGNPIGGACFALIDDGGNVVAESCDQEPYDPAEFAFNGTTGFFNAPSGTYTLQLTSAPEGVTADDVPGVEVVAGQEITETVTAGAAATETSTATATETETPVPTETAPATEEARPGDLTVTLIDQNSAPIGGACFQLLDGSGNVVQESCDTEEWESAEFANNGNTGFFDIPAGQYTLHMSQAPEGVTAVEDQPVTVAAGVDSPVTVQSEVAATETATATETETAAPTETATATETAEPGPPANLVVELREFDSDEGIGGACFTLTMEGQEPITRCDVDDDFPDNGRTGFFGIPSGVYTLTESTVPDGTNAIEPQEITIGPGNNPDLVVRPVGQPEQTETAEPTETTEPAAGTVLIDVSGVGGSGICVELNTSGGISFANPPAACDNGTGDDSDDPGIIEIGDVSPGEYILSVTSGAEGIGDQVITVSDSGPTQVTLGQLEPTATMPPPTETQVPEPTTGSLTITVVDADGSVGGVCFDVSNPSGTFSFCDDDGDGTTEIPDAVFGEQTITVTGVPDGYQTPESQSVILSVDQQGASVEFTLEQAPGAIEVTNVDPAGATVPGVCIAVDGVEAACDENNDGTVNIEAVEPGEVTVSQSSAPEGFRPTGETAVNVPADASVDVTLTSETVPGAIQVLNQDDNGDNVAGACVRLDEGDPLCDVDGDGILNFTEIPTGDHTVTQTDPPAGYQLADPADQQVTVGPDETATVTFTSAPATGSIAVTVSDGEAVSGVCVAVSADGQETQTLCETSDDGAYRFTGLAPVTWSVAVSQVPDQYVAPDPETAEVTAGQETPIEFELSPAPPETGSAYLTLISEDGQAAAGACLMLVPQDGGDPLGPVCDNAEGQDGDATEGVILIEDIPVGTYEVTFPEVSAGGDAEINTLRQQDAQPIIIEILAGQTIEQTITVPGLVVLGAIEVQVVDDATGNPVAGACFTVDTGEPTTVCDGGDHDGSTDDGTVLIDGLPASTYTVNMSPPPEGYETAADQNAEVTSGATVSLEFRVIGEVTTGNLIVAKVDDGGEALPGTCFRLEAGDSVVGPVCDDADGENDGTIVFSNVPAGDWTLVETHTPGNDWSAAAPIVVTIDPGESVQVEVTNTAAPGRLNVITVDAADQSVRLDGACYRLDGNSVYGPFCDGDDLSVDGRTVFTSVQPGTYTLVETEAPSGYDPSADREVTIRAGVTHQVTVQNQETPPPPESGTLVVNKLDANQDPLAGGCFRLFDGDRAVTGQVCDSSDGSNDGRIEFENVPVGTWALRETLAPSPSYQLAADQKVTIENGQTTEVSVVNTLKPGRILVKKVTPQGGPIEGACFALDPEVGNPVCSGENGQILFENVPVGTYTLDETTVPYGFKQAEPVEDISVRPGQTTVVTVENQRQPPPNTGTVQVRKFVCPVDSADDERTSFLGGTAGNAELAKTKGCVPADAVFTMVGQDGTDGPGAFRTGDDGSYMVTVPAKVYRIDETDPDLPGNSAALLRVEVGRMTTVVVINYIAPPEPEPIDIAVAKYTCQAGFNGTTFEDFAASCMSDGQLTNNITIRAEGPVNLKAVTGDGGQAGRTAFTDQPAGRYTIHEERPYTIPTSYAFCGWNSNWPADFKAVNGAITAELGEGAQLSCVFFNIPEPVTDSTGVILVRKYVCDVDAPPKGYTFEDECRLSDQNASFELKQYNEETTEYGEAVTQTANPDGILRFIDLRPGSYQLREVDDNWCYANSNSVNTKGDVVVRAGQVSLVSIYNCVGPSEPPNTGSGDAAGLLNPPVDRAPAAGEPGVMPGIAWPVAILAVVFALWPKRVLAPGRNRTVPSDENASDIAA